MRTIIEFLERPGDLPLLRFYIHDAPHRRQHYRVIDAYRQELVAAAKAAGISIPITKPVALSALFIDPCSCDLDNLITALFRAIDGKTHKGPSILADDSLVYSVERTSKFYPGPPRK
jgi:hypothetical protein